MSYDAAREKCCRDISWSRYTATPTTRVAIENTDEPAIEFKDVGLPPIPLRFGGRSARNWLGAECIELEEVVRALRDHVLWIDHTGINLPAAAYDGPWEELVRALGDASLMYAYPTGEPWFFILPGTVMEQASGITEFRPHRAPRFELVELSSGACAAVQFDIQTDLTNAELIALFPGNKSACLPGLESYFRSVFIKHPWEDLEIRLDLRFGPGNLSGEWETGAWLVQNGKRCNNRMQQTPRA